MLAKLEELITTSENQKSWLWRHCRRRAIYWLLRSPSQTYRQPKTQINRRRTLPASFSCWWSPQAAWPERLLSEKSGRWWYCSRLRSVALYLWLIVVISVRQSIVAAIFSFTAGRWLWSVRAWRWQPDCKIQRSGRNWPERLMYEQSHRDYLRSGYLHHRSPVMGC